MISSDYGRERLLGNNVEPEKFSLIDILLIFVIIALLINVFVQTVWLSPVKVEGPSMRQTLQNEDWLFMDKLKKPERGDVVVFKRSETVNYIKRIIALPGDEIYSEDGTVYIKIKGSESFVEVNDEHSYYSAGRPSGTYLNDDLDDIPRTVLGDGEMYVMGDNRWGSKDSRDPTVGKVEISTILGIVPDWAIDRKENLKGYFEFLEKVNNFIDGLTGKKEK